MAINRIDSILMYMYMYMYVNQHTCTCIYTIAYTIPKIHVVYRMYTCITLPVGNTMQAYAWSHLIGQREKDHV